MTPLTQEQQLLFKRWFINRWLKDRVHIAVCGITFVFPTEGEYVVRIYWGAQCLQTFTEFDYYYMVEPTRDIQKLLQHL